MASSLLLKRLASSTLLTRSLSRTITLTTTSASHVFNTNVARQYDNESDDRDLYVDHRSISYCHNFFSDMFDSFFITRSLSQNLNLMDLLTQNPFFAGTYGRIRRGWDVKDDENTLNLLIDMLGLGKE